MKYVFFLLIVLASAASAQQKDPSGPGIVYRLPDTLPVLQWYTEVTVTSAADGFYGSSFHEGSAGLEKKGSTSTLVFRLNNDAANSKLLAKGLQTEQTAPGTVTWKRNWQVRQPYKILITAIVDSASRTAVYTGYVFLPDIQQWKLLASFQSVNGGKYISEPGTGITTGSKSKKGESRKMMVQQAWVQRSNGSWKQLTEGKRTGNHVQAGTGADSSRIFLSDQPFTAQDGQGDTLIHFAGNDKRPVFSVTAHADTAAQAVIDKQEIIAAAGKGTMDTTGSVNGVYYLVVKEGTGDYVAVTDTVTVYYKGWLLKDGSVFDQTKEKPATFPLSRLIKGWQAGLPKCRVGGKVRLIIPSGLAYSVRSRSKDIPPNSVLVFEIEVVQDKRGR